MRTSIVAAGATLAALATLMIASPSSAQGPNGSAFKMPTAVFTKAIAFDVSRPVRSMPIANGTAPFREIRPENDLGPFVRNINIFRDPVVQRSYGSDSSDRLL